jgi:hypothetical protein
MWNETHKLNTTTASNAFLGLTWWVIIYWGHDSPVGIATGGTVWKSNPVRCEIFRTRPDRPWAPPSRLYNGYRVFLGVKGPGCGFDHAPQSSAEVIERVELNLYSYWETSWPLFWVNVTRTLHTTYIIHICVHIIYVLHTYTALRGPFDAGHTPNFKWLQWEVK